MCAKATVVCQLAHNIQRAQHPAAAAARERHPLTLRTNQIERRQLMQPAPPSKNPAAAAAHWPRCRMMNNSHPGACGASVDFRLHPALSAAAAAANLEQPPPPPPLPSSLPLPRRRAVFGYSAPSKSIIIMATTTTVSSQAIGASSRRPQPMRRRPRVQLK